MKKTVKPYTPAKTGEKWLILATAKKDERRPDFTHVHSNLAADGVRLHIDNSLPPCTCEFCTDRIPPVIESARASRNTSFTITNAALMTACQQAIAIGRDPRPQYDYTPVLRVSVNGSLKYSATCEGNGSVDGEWTTMQWETSRKTAFPVVSSYKTAKTGGVTISTVKVEYAHEGRDLEFGVNPKFLADALAGMDQTVTVKCNAKNAPLYITDGTREAVLMPVSI